MKVTHDQFVSSLKTMIKLIEAHAERASLEVHHYAGVLRNKPDPWLAQAKNIHKGGRCFILGNGPSLNDCDLSLLKGEMTFGVNGIFLHPYFTPTYYVTISAFFWRDHVERIRQVKCTRRFLAADMQQLASEVPTSWLNFQRPKQYSRYGIPLPVPLKFSHRPDRIIYGGGTVLFVCMQLAYHMGFNTVILLGMDHDYGQTEDVVSHGLYSVDASDIVGRHFSEHYYSSPNTRVYIDILAIECACRLAKQAFERAGRRILNATPESKLNVYPKIDYDSLF